jgi:hypothetical protein
MHQNRRNVIAAKESSSCTVCRHTSPPLARIRLVIGYLTLARATE